MNFPLKKYFVKKESWKRFGVKAGVTLVVLWAAGAAFASRYRIGIDPQQEKCLPGYTFFLIDLNDQTLERGAVYAFQAKNMQPFYKDGTRMVKILTGMPGIKSRSTISGRSPSMVMSSERGSSSQGNYICQRATFTARPR